MIINPSTGPIQLSRARLDTFWRFVEPDLRQRDERLLGDWIKRGHRWDRPSMNSFPARSFLRVYFPSKAGVVVVVTQRPRHVFCLGFSQLNNTHFAFSISLPCPWFYVTVQQSVS